jgi:hypothetical protein
MKKAPSIAFASWAVFGLPLFFVAHGLAQYISFVPVWKALALLGQYLFASASLWLLWSLILKDKINGALAAVVTMAGYLFFGAAKDGLTQLSNNSFLVKYSVFLALWIFIITACLIWIRKGRGRRLINYFGILWTVFILFDSIAIFREWPRKEGHVKTVAVNHPDVYLLVLDGYAGLAQLDGDFHFNNRPFYDSLRAIGFRVFPASRSNHEDTPFSMASLFQMDYLSLRNYEYSDKNLGYCFTRIYNNPVAKRFQAAGYVLHNHSIFDMQESEAPVSSTLLVSGSELISSQTLGQRLYRDLYSNLIYRYFPQSSEYRRLVNRARRSNELLAGKTLAEAAKKENTPRFIYTHLELPHAPYYFKADGKENAPVDLAPQAVGRRELYLGYLQYASRFTLDYIRRLRAKAGPDAVILLLSDHGFRDIPGSPWHHSNLAALYFPNGKYHAYYDSVSNVNQFPLLFHNLFGDSLLLKPDRSY